MEVKSDYWKCVHKSHYNLFGLFRNFIESISIKPSEDDADNASKGGKKKSKDDEQIKKKVCDVYLSTTNKR